MENSKNKTLSLQHSSEELARWRFVNAGLSGPEKLRIMQINKNNNKYDGKYVNL